MTSITYHRWFRVLLLYLVVVSWAFWMGGFSFYFGVVIRVGGEIVGDSSQGFITQGVTLWLNRIGLIALGVFLCQVWVSKNRWLALLWAAMAIEQGILMTLHRMLDRMLDGPNQAILDAARFPVWHEWYEFNSAIQWLAAMVFIGIL
ncbi:MAG: hypothetical protein MUF23_10630, partial [Pirellula sp.]|nr:hypothetical protein [Pirellula sp.]